MISQYIQNELAHNSNAVLNFCSIKLSFGKSMYGCIIILQLEQLSNCILGAFHEGKCYNCL